MKFPRRTSFLISLILSTFVGVLLASQATRAEGESPGSFHFTQFSISPQARVQEPSQGGFELRDSFIGFDWRRDQSPNSLSGQFSFGTGDLITPAIWYLAKPLQLEMVTAALQLKTSYMDIKAGLIPISNGYEGSVAESELLLPETDTRSRRWFTRRDYGVELKTSRSPYLAKVAIHNGESGPNSDQKLWMTGLWSYLNSSGIGLLATAEVGSTDVRSTGTSTAANLDQGFDFDPTQNAKIRHGSLSIYRAWRRNFMLAEMGRGEILQFDQKHPFGWGHVDLSAHLGGDLNLLLRYEQTQSDLNKAATVIKSSDLGFSVSSKDGLSAVTLWGKHHETNPQKSSDEALLILRLHSNLF